MSFTRRASTKAALDLRRALGTTATAQLQPQRQTMLLSVEERARQTKMLICDMAGTTVDEGGLVYITLQKVMNDQGLDVTDSEMIPWHGAQKTECVAHFVDRALSSKGEEEKSELANLIDGNFESEINDAYFSDSSPIGLIHPKLFDFFANLRLSGCQVALNTGYPKPIQLGLLKKLKLDEHVDCAVCAGEVGLGRPYPFMIQMAMKKLEIPGAHLVAKAGDTERDIEEGLNAGCGLTIGVLTGAAQEEPLQSSGADVILKNIVEFENLRK